MKRRALLRHARKLARRRDVRQRREPGQPSHGHEQNRAEQQRTEDGVEAIGPVLGGIFCGSRALARPMGLTIARRAPVHKPLS